MKKTLLATLALGLCLTAAFIGCDGGKELNDEKFVDFCIEFRAFAE